MSYINKRKNHLIISKNIKYIYIFTNEIKIFWLNHFINFYKYVILFLIIYFWFLNFENID